MPDRYSYNKRKDEQAMIETDTGKRRKEQFIENLSEGDMVNDIFAVKMKNAPRPYKRGTWFDFIAVDSTGENTKGIFLMRVNMWDGGWD